MAKAEKKTEKEAETKEKTAVKEKKEQKETKAQPQMKKVIIVSVLILLAFVVFLTMLLPNLAITVPFSTFKSGFDAAPRVAIFVTFQNQSQFIFESPCYTQLTQAIAHTRNATTIDFYIINESKCTYPVGGLGHQVTIRTNSSYACLSMAYGEPSIFLNYSANNRTVVTATKLYAYGNAAYMTSCPIAVDIS